MYLLLPTMPMEESAMKPEAPRDSEDTMATMALARDLLRLPTMVDTMVVLLMSMSIVLSTPMDMVSAILERGLLSPPTMVDMDMDLETASSMSPDLTLLM